MSKSDLEIMNLMVKQNKDIRMSPTLVSAKTVKQGGLITMGVDAQTIVDLVGKQGEYAVGLYIINLKEFNEIKTSEITHANRCDKCEGTEFTVSTLVEGFEVCNKCSASRKIKIQ